MPPPVVTALGVSKVFSDGEAKYNALRNVDLVIKEGEFIGLSGPSGSGKTTLLSVIGALDTPTSGDLTLFGKDVKNLKDAELSRIRLENIGFIFQEHNLLPALTVRENMELPMLLKGTDQKKRSKKVKDLLNIVGLKNLENRYPSQLSRGQRQRIAAIRSFVNNPKMILADEPTSDLDPENAGILLNFLGTLNKDAGITIIIASTSKEDFNKITSRNLRIENGRIV